MDYNKEAAVEEVKSWKRRDPRAILPSLGWMVKAGSYKARFVNSRAEELDLWGGDNGNFFAFSTPGKKSVYSILDLAMWHVGSDGKTKYKEACELLRKLFSETSKPAGKWDEDTEEVANGETVDGVTAGYWAGRIRKTASEKIRMPLSVVGDKGLSVVGWHDVGEDFGGSIGVWSTASHNCQTIRVYADARAALYDDREGVDGVMRVYCPRGAEAIAASLCKIAAAKIECPYIEVHTIDTADGDIRRGEIRKALDYAKIDSRGYILLSSSTF